MNIRQTLAQWFYSPGAYGLWLALDDVDEWDNREGYIVYRIKGAKRDHYGDPIPSAVLCTEYGPFGFNGAANKGTPKFLGLLERWPLWWKYKRMNNRRMLYRFTRLEEPK